MKRTPRLAAMVALLVASTAQGLAGQQPATIQERARGAERVVVASYQISVRRMRATHMATS